MRILATLNPTQNNSYRAKLFIVGVDAAKDIVVSRMRLKVSGAGFMHLPDWAEDEYIAQLTSEKAMRKYVRGRGATLPISPLPASRPRLRSSHTIHVASTKERGCCVAVIAQRSNPASPG